MVHLTIACRLLALAAIWKCLLRNLQGLRDEVVLHVATGLGSRLQDLITTKSRRNILIAHSLEQAMSPGNARRDGTDDLELQ